MLLDNSNLFSINKFFFNSLDLSKPIIHNLSFVDLKATLETLISGKYESYQICFRKEYNSNKNQCRNLKELVGEIQFEYEKELFFGEKYYFYIKTTGCKSNCISESDEKIIQLCLSNKKFIFFIFKKSL